MGKSKLLVMPGMSSPLFNSEHQQIYATLEEGAKQCNFEYNIVYYPGQEGVSSGVMTYSGQLENALSKCRAIQPNWIIGLSSGCEVVVGCLGSKETWVDQVQGAVIWGSCLNARGASMFSSSDERYKYLAQLTEEPNRTFVSLDYLETTPCISKLIEELAGNIRIARGSKDPYNTSEDALLLAEVHWRCQSQYKTEICEILELEHSVRSSETSVEKLNEYFQCLFTPFTAS